MKTSELEGEQLDAAVARAEGLDVHVVQGGFTPSTRWHDAGPIIEREHIVVWGPFDYVDEHESPDRDGYLARVKGMYFDQRADSYLVAAMRAYVSSKFGDTVDP